MAPAEIEIAQLGKRARYTAPSSRPSNEHLKPSSRRSVIIDGACLSGTASALPKVGEPANPFAGSGPLFCQRCGADKRSIQSILLRAKGSG